MKGKILGISLSVLGVASLVITLIGILGDVSYTQVDMLLQEASEALYFSSRGSGFCPVVPSGCQTAKRRALIARVERFPHCLCALSDHYHFQKITV